MSRAKQNMRRSPPKIFIPFSTNEKKNERGASSKIYSMEWPTGICYFLTCEIFRLTKWGHMQLVAECGDMWKTLRRYKMNANHRWSIEDGVQSEYTRLGHRYIYHFPIAKVGCIYRSIEMKQNSAGKRQQRRTAPVSSFAWFQSEQHKELPQLSRRMRISSGRRRMKFRSKTFDRIDGMSFCFAYR